VTLNCACVVIENWVIVKQVGKNA